MDRIRISTTEDITEVDLKDFYTWVCSKAERLGFKIEKIYEDREMERDRGDVHESTGMEEGNQSTS